MMPRQHGDRSGRPRGVVRGLLAGALAVVVGCGDEAPVAPPIPVATTVTVSPASATMQALEDTVRFSATVLDQDGRVMAGAVVEWSSSDERVAAVDGAGLVTAARNGTATVTAGSGGVVGQAVVTVEQMVAEVRLVPESVAFVAIGDTAWLAAEAVDGNGHGVAGAVVEWSSGDTAVAVVDSAGAVVAVGNGEATVTAGSGGVVGEVVVAVEQVVVEVRVVPDSVAFAAIGDTARLAAEVADANGHGVAGAVVEWSSGDTAVAVVDSAGAMVAVGNGEATVTAGSGGVVGQAVVTVEQVVAEVRVVPDSVAFAAIGDTARLAAEVADANGHGVAGAAVEWSSGDTAVAVVDSAGAVVAVGNGEATVTAGSGGVVGQAVVTVEQVVAEVRVVPDSVAFAAIGDTARLAAEVADANGHGVAGAVVEWSSGDTAVAVVDSAGAMVAVGNGEATVTAGSGGVVGQAVVTVEQVVAEVRVVPEAVVFTAIGDTAQLFANAFDASGHVVDGIDFAWSTSDETVAVVDATGLLTSVGTGTASVTAATGSVEGSATAILGGEREILEAFYHAAGGPQWVRDDNWLTDAPASEWYGIYTDGEGRVTQIALRNNGLLGTLSPLVAGLTQLRHLNFYSPGVLWCDASAESAKRGTDRPSFSTTISELTAGSDMRRIRRRGANGWTEGIELTLHAAPALEANTRASVSEGRRNRLSGTIPSALGQLSELVSLTLTNNDFSGVIPPELGQLTNIYAIDLSQNRLSGRIPSEIGSLATLEWLVLAGNELTGPIPEELGNLSSLVHLNISNNNFGDPLPPAIGRLAQLRTLIAMCASFNGPLPSELGNLQRLENLHLFSSRLTGSIPPELGNMASLSWLELQYNRLSGSIPPELAGLSNLKALGLGGNQLTGTVPPALGGLSALRLLDLEDNRLSGSIPPALGQLSDLVGLTLARNALTGEIPPAVGRLVNLQTLFLEENQLSGPLPPELGELSNLVGLYLSRNQLSGEMPPELGRLASLGDLSLDGNRLSGPIPAELGRLTNLWNLDLPRNDLTGQIPWELGFLSNLGTLALQSNHRLSGPLPLSLANLEKLEILWWFGTTLCVPRDRAFQDWLARVRITEGPPDQTCSAIPTSVLEAFHSATGGAGWRNSANWLTDAPLSSWHGITVEDSLVTALDLSDNNLVGTLPPEIGAFLDVRSLDLSDNGLSDSLPSTLGDLERLGSLDLSNNGFSGAVPRSIGRLDALGYLDLSGNEMAGALPSTFVELDVLDELRWRGSGLCAPEATWFQTWLSSVATRDGPTCDAPYVLSIPRAHLTQATQSMNGAVPIIAGRPALLRIFATADRANDHQPITRATLRVDGGRPFTGRMTLESRRGVPDATTVGDLALSYNAVVPASVLRAGVEMVVEMDPDSTIPRAVGSQVRLPEVGGLALDVRELPTMELTIVPVVAESSADSSVLDWVRSPSDPPMELLRSILPIAGLELTVREPLRIGGAPGAPSFDDWPELLQYVDLLRITEDKGGYWYGVVKRDGEEGIAGIAYLSGRASLGIPDAEIFAHEVGHNMSLRHAPCGGPFSFDPDFPYLNGSIGVPGYDFRSGELVDPSTPDVMSYCGGAWRGGPMQWISDYHFNKAMQYRLTEEVAGPARAAAAPAPPPPPAPRLLIRGGISPDGDLHLDPAFVLDALAKTPTAPGPYRIAAVATDGSTIFEHSFDMDEISIGGGGFLFLLPLSETAIGDLERIVLTGPDGTAQLDRDTPVDPVAIVMDRATGRIRSILRGEAAVEAAEAQAMGAASGTGAATAGTTGATHATLTLVSYGLPGTGQR